MYNDPLVSVSNPPEENATEEHQGAPEPSASRIGYRHVFGVVR